MGILHLAVHTIFFSDRIFSESVCGSCLFVHKHILLLTFYTILQPQHHKAVGQEPTFQKDRRKQPEYGGACRTALETHEVSDITFNF